jgi:hypothetical protein
MSWEKWIPLAARLRLERDSALEIANALATEAAKLLSADIDTRANCGWTRRQEALRLLVRANRDVAAPAVVQERLTTAPMPARPRVYLSGPMTGLPELNFPAFRAAAARLRAAGYDAVNPAEINPDPAADWHQCLRKDMAALAGCDVLALLPGWPTSQGAHLELHVAHRLGLRIVMLEELLA